MPWSPAPATSSSSSPSALVRRSYAWFTPWAMSGDCSSIALMTAQVLQSNP
jgi:hypothetical protein